MFGLHWLGVLLSLVGCLAMIDLVQHVKEVDRSVFVNAARFAGVLLLLPAMYYLAYVSEPQRLNSNTYED